MGIDAGFDMFPPLSQGELDKQNWSSFIQSTREFYKNDELVEAKPHFLLFKAGEHPQLPFEGHKFLRFSAKISGSHCGGVEKYIDKVYQIARANFGSRVQYWNDAADGGVYSWQEVNDSLESYAQSDEPVLPTTMAQDIPGTDSVKFSDLELFSIEIIPGKGRGLVARLDIIKGTRILYEQPLFTTPNLTPIERMEKNIALELEELSEDQKQQFFSLHNNFPGSHPLSGIVKTNALPCGSGSPVGGLYHKICLINHSCLPNAHNNWNSNTNLETIHAIRYIKAGEEITISYSKDGSASTRKAYLREKFGFECNCPLCSLPPEGLQISDARRLEINYLDETIGAAYRVLKRPEQCIANCHKLLKILKDEYRGSAGALIARLYYDAFQISITHGDQARASIFAERGYKTRLICEGEDSPATQIIKNLMENPSEHRNFGASGKWRTSKELVPKDLDTAGFEKWLWRQVD